MNFWNFILLCFGIFKLYTSAQTSAYNQYARQANSARIQIYSSTSTGMLKDANNPYQINYATLMTNTPEVVLGLSDFRQGSDLGSNYLRIVLAAITQTGFSITVRSSGSSSLYILYISYLALYDQFNNFYTIIRALGPPLNNIASGSGNRVEQITGNFFTLTSGSTLNSDLSKNKCIPFINGFEFSSTGQFTLHIEVIIQSTISFKTKIYAIANQAIYTMRISYLFIDTQIFVDDTSNILITSQLHHQTSVVSILTLPRSSTNGNYILAASMIKGRAQSTDQFLQFTLNIDATGETLTINNGNNWISQMYMEYCFIAQIYCPIGYSYFRDSTKSRCVDQCSGGQAQDPISNICQTCNHPCQECTESIVKCTVCQSGYQLSNNVCTFNNTPPTQPQTPEQETPIQQNSGPSYGLLALLGIIPIIILIVSFYFCARRRNARIKIADFRNQPTIDRL